jgi:hypothetical protein
MSVNTSDPYSPDYRLDCGVLFGSHSDDRTKVWHGDHEPFYMCGRHAANMTANDYIAMSR